MPFWLKYVIVDLIASIAVALLLRQFLCLLCHVKGRSMQDTLHDGEVVFALRRGIQREIHRFDIVLCKYPNRKGLFVKRVVGLPGESIRIEEDILYINDEAVEENFARRRCVRPMTERQIGAGEYFLMGDNRLASHDSRSVGPISHDMIVAVVKCVVFPFGKIRRIH